MNEFLCELRDLLLKNWLPNHGRLWKSRGCDGAQPSKMATILFNLLQRGAGVPARRRLGNS